MSFDAFWNHATAVVQGGFDASATTIQLVSGGAARFPNLSPFVPFQLLWWNSTTYPDPDDDPNREIVRVTSLNPGTDQLVVVRGQETSQGGVAASTKNTPNSTYKVRLVISAKFFEDLQAILIDFGQQYAWVTEFGAKGDGTTDDTTAIEAAIAAGNIVVFPPGTYLVNGGLTLKSGLTFQGSGEGVTTIRLKNSATQAAVLDGTSLVDVMIRDLTIDGNESNNATNGHGISIDGATRLTIQNVTVKNMRDSGVLLGGASGSIKHTRILSSRFLDCHGDLVRIENRGSTNVGNEIGACLFSTPGLNETTAQAAIAVRGPIQITDCTIEGVHDNTIGVLLEETDGTLGAGASEASVAGCKVTGTAHASNVSIGYLVQAERCRLVGCMVSGTDRGFQLDETDADDSALVGWVARDCADEGVRVGADRVLLHGGHTSGATTGINVLAAAADTRIFHNVWIAGTTKVTNSGTNTHARSNGNWVTEATIQIANVDNAGSTGQWHGVATAHGLDVTPSKHHCNVSQSFDTEPASPAVIRGPYVTAVDGTNVTVRTWLTSGGSSGSNIQPVCHINALP